MKKYIYLAVFVFLGLIIRCASDFNIDLDQKKDDNIGKTVAVKVKEYKTNLPVSGVSISIYYCKQYDFEFGNCSERAVMSTCVTDDDGSCSCSFPKNSFEYIDIVKSNYWPKHYHNIESSQEYLIQPQAWVNINFTTTNEYPSTCTFFINISGELNSTVEYIQPKDSANKVITLYGNEVNKVNWVLYETFNSSSPVLNSGSFTLEPKKFEDLTYTLNY